MFVVCTCFVYADKGRIRISNAVVSEDSQRAVILYNTNKEVLILGTDMSSDVTTTALMFIPFPSNPKVGLADPDAMANAANLVQTYMLKFTSALSKGKGVSGGYRQAGVVLELKEKLNGHDLTVVKVNSMPEFKSWVRGFLKKKGITFEEDRDTETIVADYLQKNIKYFVFDMVDITQEMHSVAPLMYTFKSKMLYYPLTTSNTLSGRRKIDIILITTATEKSPGRDSVYDKDSRSYQFFEYSSSAKITGSDLENIYPGYKKFFEGHNIYIQLMKYAGVYNFKNDILIDPATGVDKALDIPSYYYHKLSSQLQK